MRRVSITLAMFLNNATRFYHFGDVFKQSITLDGCRLDDRLFVWTIVCSFGRSFVRLDNRLFVWTIVCSFGRSFVRHLGDVLKQYDAFLSLWMDGVWTIVCSFGRSFVRLDDHLFVWTIVQSKGFNLKEYSTAQHLLLGG